MLHAAGAVPVVFVTGADPVTSGLVAKLNRPEGNATGVSIFTGPLAGKQIGIIRSLLPQAHVIAVVVDAADTADTASNASATTDIITAGGLQPLLFTIASPEDIDKAFAAAAERHADAVLLASSPLMTSQRDRLVSLALRHKLPAVFPLREYAVAGGLMSYGASIAGAYRQAGIYAGRILKGEKPADLPVMLPTKFEFVINLKTAKALGLTIPPTLLALADEVIE
jgi:putative ABC transport system substrate-binding protein